MHPFITFSPIIFTNDYNNSPAISYGRKRSIAKTTDMKNQICQRETTQIKMAEFKRAVKKCNINKIICLVNQGVDLNRYCANKTDNDICPVELAIKIGDLKLLKYLLKSGANPNIQHKYMTALSFVVNDIYNKKYEEIIKLLVQYGADVNYIDVFGCSILDITILEKEFRVAKWLLMHGANHNLKNQNILKFIKKEL